MVPISLLPLLHNPWIKSPKSISLKPLLIKHTTSFQDWPCNQYKFYKLQGTLGDRKLMSLPQLFLTSQKRRLLYPRHCPLTHCWHPSRLSPHHSHEENSPEPSHRRPCKATEDTEVKHATSWMKHYPDSKLVWHFHSKGFWGTRSSNIEHVSFGLFLEGPVKWGIF